MCKLAGMVGKTAIVNSYLSSFCLSCEDTGFQVRRVCAMGMANMCTVVGPILTEKALLPRFLTLCEDEIWGVRKSCAEVFTAVARVCSHNVRRKCLAQAFINLLEDQSRWVRLTAFQTLGQFIATFFHEEGDDVVVIADEFEQNFLLEMKNNVQIVMEKRNREILEASARKAAAAEARVVAEKENGLHELNGNDSHFTGNGDGSSKTEQNGPERALDPFDDDDEDWEYPSHPTEEKQYSWLLDRSFGPEPDRDWGGEEDWGDVPMDCSDDSDLINQPAATNVAASEEDDDGFGEWKDAMNSIPENFDLKAVDDEEAIVTRDKEKHDVVERKREDPIDIPPVTFLSHVVNKELIEKSELDQPASVALTSNDKPDRIQIHVGAPSSRNTVFSPTPSCTSSSGISSLSSTETSSFNTFQYWRVPIPDLEMNIDIKNGKATNVHVRAKVRDHSNRLTYSSELNVSIRMEEDMKNGMEKGFDSGKATKDTNTVEEDWDSGIAQANVPTDVPHRIAVQKEQTFETEDWDEPNRHVTILLESSGRDARTSGSVVRISQDVHRSYYNLHTVSTPSNCENGNVIEVKYQKKVEPSEGMISEHEEFYRGMRNVENLPYIVRAHGPSGDQGRLLPILQTSSTVQDQEVVPPKLLTHYLSMAELTCDNSPVEVEMPVHCAYTFPGVVITIGGEHWPILRECFEKMATMFQWKIRYTLGACLHEIAKTIGPELTERDLLPFYDAITKDIDEVRSGILSHIAEFTRILRAEARICVLDTLKNFLRTDNKNNWRFRFELAVQIEELTEIYDPEAVYCHLCPMALQLANDPVADVRRAALRVITEQVKKLNQVKDWDERPGGNLLRQFIQSLVEQFCHSVKWVQRQSFATLSGQLIVLEAIDPTQFAQHILPHLISLSHDKVPNIRLTVAQTLSCHVMKMDFFAQSSNPHHSILVDTLKKLQTDEDGDVRYYSGGEMRSNPKTLKETAAATLEAHQANHENPSAS